MSITTVLNLSDAQKKQMLIQHIRTLEGDHRVEIVRARMNASQKQHAYYRGLVLPMIVDELKARGYVAATSAMVHNAFAETYLRVAIANQKTGQVWKEAVRSSGDLNTQEMGEFIENVRNEAARDLGLDTPDPDPMWRLGKVTKDSPRARGNATTAA